MPRIPEHLRKIASLTQHEVTKIISKYARLTAQQLKEVLEAKEAPALELSIASIFAKSIMYGDSQRLAFLLDRAVGKVPVTQETDEDLAARRELQDLTTSELLQLVRENVKDPEKAPE